MKNDEIMKKMLVLLILIFNIEVFALPRVVIYYELSDTKDTVTYFLDNREIFPVSIAFSGQPIVENMKIDGLKNAYVLSPGTTKNKIISFAPIDKTKSWGIVYMPAFKTFVGDVSVENYDTNYVYDLPFRSGKTFQVSQGYGGSFSHQGENAIDFTLPEGTAILAARGGTVIEMVDKNDGGCATQDCAKDGNYITILHDDGTLAEYFHLQKYGSRVKVGQKVEKGDVLALSGNTGFSKAAHLHFAVYIPSPTEKNWRTTLKTKFATNTHSEGEFLISKNSYTKP